MVRGQGSGDSGGPGPGDPRLGLDRETLGRGCSSTRSWIASKIDAALAANGTEEEYEQRTSIATYLLAGAFILSAILNFVLARMIVTSDPGTDAFNSELGRMTALSYPVIMVPVMVVLMATIFYVFNTVGKLTGLESKTS